MDNGNWKVWEVTHRASRLPDSEWTRLWSTPWFVPNSPNLVALAGIRAGGLQAEPCPNHQGLIRATGITFLPFSSEICRLLWIGTQIILSFLEEKKGYNLFFIIGTYTTQQCVRLYSGPWFAHWPFGPVECCACRAEVIINWCLTFFVWLSLSDVIAASLTIADLSLWEVSHKRGLLGVTVDLKISAPFYKKHTAHHLWNMSFTESERNKVFYRCWAQLQLFLFINVQ